MRHVDVVKNEWLAGFQHLVARVYVEDDAIQLEASDHDLWANIVLRAHVDRETGEEITPDQGPEFVDRLHVVLSGDYLFATEPHDDSECPFHGQLVIPIARVEPQPQYNYA